MSGAIEPVPPQPLPHVRAIRWIAVALCAASAVLLWPYAAWLILAGWTAALATPLVDRMGRRGNRRRTAAVLVMLTIVFAVAGSLVVVLVPLWRDAGEFLREMAETRTGRQALEMMVSPREVRQAVRSGDLVQSPAQAVSLIQRGGPEALSIAGSVVGAAGRLLLGFVVFLVGTYVGLVEGRAAAAWAIDHAPLARRDALRFARAFVETGRGLLFGFGLTGLAQAALATAAYAVVGIDRVLVLGFLTFFASFIPTIGTGLVWGPVAIGLWVTGRHTEAIAMVLWNALVVSTVDNLLRPLLARVGQVDMHLLLLLVSMLGGLVAIGGWGLMLGPLVVRLTLEAVRIVMPDESEREAA